MCITIALQEMHCIFGHMAIQNIICIQEYVYIYYMFYSYYIYISHFLAQGLGFRTCILSFHTSNHLDADPYRDFDPLRFSCSEKLVLYLYITFFGSRLRVSGLHDISHRKRSPMCATQLLLSPSISIIGKAHHYISASGQQSPALSAA